MSKIDYESVIYEKNVAARENVRVYRSNMCVNKKSGDPFISIDRDRSRIRGEFEQ